MLGMADNAVAGDMEIDQAPYQMDGGRWGYRVGNAELYDSMLRDGLNDAQSLAALLKKALRFSVTFVDDPRHLHLNQPSGRVAIRFAAATATAGRSVGMAPAEAPSLRGFPSRPAIPA